MRITSPTLAKKHLELKLSPFLNKNWLLSEIFFIVTSNLNPKILSVQLFNNFLQKIDLIGFYFD